MSDFNYSSSRDTGATGSSARANAEDEIVLVPVPRSRLRDVYAVLGRDGSLPRVVPWEPLAVGVVRGSAWVAREVAVPAARELARQRVASELGGTLASAARRSARVLLESMEQTSSRGESDAEDRRRGVRSAGHS
jgi:hypothetical protein